MKYSKEIVEKILKNLKKGATIKSTCAAVGISKGIFYEWKKTKLDFLDSVEAAMAVHNRAIESAHGKSAKGFYYTETEYKAVQKGEKIVMVPVKKTRKYQPTNVSAAQFELKNRNPEEWKDKTERELSGELKVKLERVVTSEKPR